MQDYQIHHCLYIRQLHHYKINHRLYISQMQLYQMHHCLYISHYVIVSDKARVIMEYQDQVSLQIWTSDSTYMHMLLNIHMHALFDCMPAQPELPALVHSTCRYAMCLVGAMLRADLEQELVARKPLNGSEEVGGETQPLAQRTLLQQGQDFLELRTLCLVAGQRPHGNLELPHVHSVHVEEFQLQIVEW